MKRLTVQCALGAALVLGLTHCGSSSDDDATPNGASGSGGAGAESGSAGTTAGAGSSGASGTAGAAGGVACGEQTCSATQYCRAPCSGTGTGGTGADQPLPNCFPLPGLCNGTPTCDCICGSGGLFCPTGSDTLPRTAVVQCGCA